MGLISLPDFLHDFSRKISLMLYSINWPNMCIVVAWHPVCDVINFEICRSFLSTGPKYQNKNVNNSRTKSDFMVKQGVPGLKAFVL